MPKYTVTTRISLLVSQRVEAESSEEAVSEANRFDYDAHFSRQYGNDAIANYDEGFTQTYEVVDTTHGFEEGEGHADFFRDAMHDDVEVDNEDFPDLVRITREEL